MILDNIQLKAWSKLAAGPAQLVHMLIAIDTQVFTLQYNTQTGLWLYCCLLLCLPAALNLYIVGVPGCSGDSITVVLELHVLIKTRKKLYVA